MAARKLLGGAGVAFGGRLMGGAFDFARGVVCARLLPPETFGLFVLALTFVRVAGLVGPLGTTPALLKYGPAYLRADEARLSALVRASLRIAAGSGLLLGVALYLLAEPLAERVFREPDLTTYLRWAAAALVAVVVLQTAATTTQITQQMRDRALTLDAGQPFVAFIVLVPLLWIGVVTPAAALGIALMASYGVAAVGAVALVRWRLPLGNANAGARFPANELLRYGLPATGANIVLWSLLWADRLWLGVLGNAADVAVYGVASQMAVILLTVTAAIGAMQTPALADALEDGDFAGMKALCRTGVVLGGYAGLAYLTVTLLAGSDAVALVFGESFREAGALLGVLLAGYLPRAFGAVAGILLLLRRGERRWLLLTGGAVVLNFGLNAALIPAYGAMGAATATAAANAILYVAAIGAVWRRYDLRLWVYITPLMVITAAAAFGGGWALGTIVDGVWRVVLVGVWAGITFGVGAVWDLRQR